MLICHRGSFFLVFVSVIILTFSSISFAELNGKQVFKSKCSMCHSLNLVDSHKNFSVNYWITLIDRMKSLGLKITKEEQLAVATYLSKNIK